MAISDYIVTIDTNWVTGWGITSRDALGFHIEFNVSPPPLAKVHWMVWGGSPPRKLTEAVFDQAEDVMFHDVVFGVTVEEPCGERTAEVIQLEMCEIAAAIMRIVKQERLDAVDLGGRVEQYTSTKIKELRDLYKDLQDELVALNLVTAPRWRMIRTTYGKGL